MEINYEELYNKYKRKYTMLKELNRIKKDTNYSFCFIHRVWGSNKGSLQKILKDGVLKKGSELPKELRQMSGKQSLSYIYGLIQFDDLDNNDIYDQTKSQHLKELNAIVIHPKILYDMDIIYNEKWQATPSDNSIYVYKDDPELKTKIKEMHDNVLESSSPINMMNNEILFTENINLNKYILAIMCSKEYRDEIKQIIKDKPYKHVKVISDIDKIKSVYDMI